MPSLAKLAIVALGAMALGVAAGQAQTKPNTAKCGVETWSTDKMTYEMTPCTGGEQTQDAKKPNTPSKANPNAAKCGVETCSTDKMTYEMTPCIGTQ